MNINWKVRIKNKNFWITVIPAFLLFVQAVLSIFGVSINIGEIGNKLIAVVNTAFVVLTILGIVTDPTTDGFSDSIQAMTYEEPKPCNIVYTDTPDEVEETDIEDTIEELSNGKGEDPVETEEAVEIPVEEVEVITEPIEEEVKDESEVHE